MQPFDPASVSMKDGAAKFHKSERPLAFDLHSFWRWASSDLLNNAVRGLLAEYLVARAIGDVESRPRSTWDACDVTTSAGVKVEVKSAAYVQSWNQSKTSSIRFGIAPTIAPGEMQDYKGAAVRQADVYVFCLLHPTDRPGLDPMDLDQWTLYVLARRRLDEECGKQATIALTVLRGLGARETNFEALAEAVDLAAAESHVGP